MSVTTFLIILGGVLIVGGLVIYFLQGARRQRERDEAWPLPHPQPPVLPARQRSHLDLSARLGSRVADLRDLPHAEPRVEPWKGRR